MSEQPRIEMRSEQPYVGTRMVIAMRDFECEIPAMASTVSRWLDAHHIPVVGQPFLRYHVIDMPERMDVEFGMPTDGLHAVSGEVAGQLLPAGRYAVLTYMGWRTASRLPASSSTGLPRRASSRFPTHRSRGRSSRPDTKPSCLTTGPNRTGNDG